MSWLPGANPAKVMSSIIRRRNGVIVISLRSKIGRGPPTQPREEILSTVQISDAALKTFRVRNRSGPYIPKIGFSPTRGRRGKVLKAHRAVICFPPLSRLSKAVIKRCARSRADHEENALHLTLNRLGGYYHER